MIYDLKTAADALDVAAMAQVAELAEAQGTPLEAAWASLVAEFTRRSKLRVAAGPDGRAVRWRVRVRLYSDARPNEPEADSDPDLAADKPGAEILTGLPAVAEHLRALATAFHGQDPAGLDDATLLHRIKSLRPTLSRRGGDAVWRVPYMVTPAERFGHRGNLAMQHKWLARVDIERVA